MLLVARSPPLPPFQAKEFRATGEEEAQKIRADAEKTRTVIISEAQREARAAPPLKASTGCR